MTMTLESHAPASNPDVAEPHWEEDLASLLEELSQMQTQLLDVLSQKRERMAAGDAKGMAALQPTEKALCTRLENCHRRRTQLLETASQNGLPGESLGSLAGTLSPGSQGSLRKEVKTVSSRMRLLQHQSLTNWVLAQKTLLHLSQMLEIIATGGRLQPTYGNERCDHGCGALVDREV